MSSEGDHLTLSVRTIIDNMLYLELILSLF